MRNIFCIVSMIALNVLSMAVQAEQELLVRETSGGNTPPHMRGWEERIVIYQSGLVTAQYRQNFETPRLEIELGHLSTDVVQGLLRQVAEIQDGELIYPDDPECFDLPSTSYSAYNALNQNVQFASRVQCRDGRLAKFYAAQSLVEILDAYRTLYFYAQK